jgi:RNA polymerase sigma factor (sigma-70 family)
MDPRTFEGMLAIMRCADIAESVQIVLAPGSWLWEQAKRVARSVHRGRTSPPFEDMFQAVLLRLARGYGGIVATILRGTRDDRAFLNRCLCNACCAAALPGRRTRQAIPFSDLEGDDVDGGYGSGFPDQRESPDARLAREELLARVRTAIPQLLQEDQVTLLLYLKTGKMTEVARATGKSYDQVRASLKRSVERLRFLLREKSI